MDLVNTVWILGHWNDQAEVGSKLLTANWHIDGAFLTRDEAAASGEPGEFLARLPIGRAPRDETVLLDVEWIDDVRKQASSDRVHSALTAPVRDATEPLVLPPVRGRLG